MFLEIFNEPKKYKTIIDEVFIYNMQKFNIANKTS